MDPKEFLKHIGWHEGTNTKINYNDLCKLLELFLDKKSTPSVVEQPKDIKEVTGFNTMAEYQAYTKGRGDEQTVIMKFIEEWDGSTNSAAGALLASKLRPAAGIRWVKGEYESLYAQVKGGKCTVCYIDTNSFNNNHPAPRDICTAKVFPEYIEFLSRGHGYATIWNHQTIDTFVKICESVNVEWLCEGESTPSGSLPEREEDATPWKFAYFLEDYKCVKIGPSLVVWQDRKSKECFNARQLYVLYTQSLQP